MKYLIKYYAKFDFSEFSELKDFIRTLNIPDEIKPDEFYVSCRTSAIDDTMKYEGNLHIDYKNDGEFYDVNEVLELSDKLSQWEVSLRSNYFDVRIENSYDPS